MRIIYSGKAITYSLFSILFFNQAFCNAQSVSIGPSAHIIVSGNAHLQLSDVDFLNNGSFIPGSGTVTFGGSSISGSLIGGSSTGINKLSINRTVGNLLLQTDIHVGDTVEMISNNIDLNNHILDLGLAGFIHGEQNNSRVTGAGGGYIRAVAAMNAPVNADAGNLGLKVSSAANMGLTEVRRSHTPFQVSTADQSINRYYYVTPANNNNLAADLEFHYLDAELNTSNESNLQIWSSVNNTSSWSLYARNAINTTANFITLLNIDTLSHITLATNINNVTPLGLALLDFAAKLHGGRVLLNWSTTLEKNVSHFDVERADADLIFTTMTKVAGGGNSNAVRNYRHVDETPNLGINYYRLRMVDNDGSYRYSPVARINLLFNKSELLSVYPNPAQNIVNIRLLSSDALLTRALIIDMAGKFVAEYPVEISLGEQTVSLPIGALASGDYFIRFAGIDIPPVKLMKE